MSDKLSDLIKWDQDSLHLLDSILARIRTAVAEDCKQACFKNNKPTISKSVLFNVLHNTRPIAWFVDPED